MLEHLSIFLENKPGKLNRIIEILAQEKINLRAFSIAGAGSFGVLKILVDNPEKAAQLLFSKGLAVAKKQIAIAVIGDEPGALNRLLAALSSNGVNMADSYGFLLQAGKSAAIVLECEGGNYDKAIDTIKGLGLNLLSDLSKLSE